MRIYWLFLFSIALVNASSWFGSSDPVDCSSILSPSLTSSVASQACTASHSISSIAAQATREAVRAFDDTKDYIYSTWDDSRLRKWLEDNGVVEARKAKTHTELVNLANHYTRKVSVPAWQSWSDSYMVNQPLGSHEKCLPSAGSTSGLSHITSYLCTSSLPVKRSSTR